MNMQLTEKQSSRLQERLSELPIHSRPSGDYEYNAQRLLAHALDIILDSPPCVFANLVSQIGGGARAEITPWQSHENKVREDQMRELHDRLALANAVESFVVSLKKGGRP